MKLSIREIAEKIDARFSGDGDMMVHSVSSINVPEPGTVLYAETMSLLTKLERLQEYAVIIPDDPGDKKGNFIVHPEPRVAFSLVSAMFNQPYWLEYMSKEKDAHIEDGVIIDETVVICAGSFVGSGTKIGAGTRILPNVFVGRNVVVGENCILLPGSVIMDGARIGDRVMLNPNVVIGGEGFGFSEYQGSIIKMPQTGSVVIGDDVEIGAGSCIDRGTIDNTVIGSGSKLDNMVQIGHNVKIGRNVRIAGQAGLSGRVTVEDNVVIGGQAGFQNGIRIGKGTTVAGQAGVFHSVDENQIVSGYPAIQHKKMMRLLALFKRLPEMMSRIKKLEEKGGSEDD